MNGKHLYPDKVISLCDAVLNLSLDIDPFDTPEGFVFRQMMCPEAVKMLAERVIELESTLRLTLDAISSTQKLSERAVTLLGGIYAVLDDTAAVPGMADIDDLADLSKEPVPDPDMIEINMNVINLNNPQHDGSSWSCPACGTQMTLVPPKGKGE